VKITEAGRGVWVTDPYLHCAGSPIEGGLQQGVDRPGDNRCGPFDRGGEGTDVGFEPSGASGLDCGLHVGTRGALHERLDQEFGPDDLHVPRFGVYLTVC